MSLFWYFNIYKNGTAFQKYNQNFHILFSLGARSILNVAYFSFGVPFDRNDRIVFLLPMS